MTVSPSQPNCPASTSCYVDMTGYCLEFAPQCTGSTGCSTVLVPLAPGGHFSALLNPGDYTLTGLSPSCQWTGCTSAFPRTVTVEGGSQLVLNLDIDTGIR